jgi:hypothetical protein
MSCSNDINVTVNDLYNYNNIIVNVLSGQNDNVLLVGCLSTCESNNIFVQNIIKDDCVVIVDNLSGYDINLNIEQSDYGYRFINFMNTVSSYLPKIKDVSDNLIYNSSLYLNLEEINKLNFITPLTSKWQETTIEVDTIQNSLSTNWQNAYIKVDSGIIDGGYC